MGLISRIFCSEQGEVVLKTVGDMRLAWLTVNYHQDVHLITWYESVQRALSKCSVALDAYVVDNSGTAQGFPQNSGVAVLRPGANLGYFGGLNYCVDRISPTNYDFIVCSNPDVAFDESFVGNLILSCETYPDHVHVIAPRIVSDTGREQNPHVEARIGHLRRMHYRLMFSNYLFFLALGAAVRVWRNVAHAKREAPGARRSIYMAHGSCFVLTRAFFAKHPRLDDRVFLWGEEAMLRHQVSCAGGSILFEPDMLVFHKEHSATTLIPGEDRYRQMKRSYDIYKAYL